MDFLVFFRVHNIKAVMMRLIYMDWIKTYIIRYLDHVSVIGLTT